MGLSIFYRFMQTIVAGEIKISRTSYFTDKPQLSENNELIKSFTPSNQSVIYIELHFDTPWWFTL